MLFLKSFFLLIAAYSANYVNIIRLRMSKINRIWIPGFHIRIDQYFFRKRTPDPSLNILLPRISQKRVRHCGFSVNKCLSTWQVFTRLYTANSVRLTRLNQDAKRPPIEGCLLLADWHNLHPSCPEARLPYWPSSHTIVFWSFRISLLSDYSVSPKTVSFVTMSLPSSQWIKTESPATNPRSCNHNPRIRSIGADCLL